MKFAIVLVIALAIIALSQAAPTGENVAMVETENGKEAQMNELADPNCGPKGDSDSSDSDPSTSQVKNGEKGKGKKGKGMGGKGKKGGKGKGKGDKDKKPEGDKDKDTPPAETEE